MPSPSSSSSTSSVFQTTSLSINALIAGDKWGGAAGSGVTLTYSFPWSSGGALFLGHNGTGNYSTINEQNATYHYALSTFQQAAARSAMTTWSNLANVKFSEVTESSSTVGDIRFAWTSATTPTSGGKAWGWAYTPDNYYPNAGDIWVSSVSSAFTDLDWSAGSYNFSGLIHELGHALGLKHPFEDTPVLTGSQDSEQYTIMSYTEHTNNVFRKVTATGSGKYSFDYIHVEPDTPMLYDVAAIQYIYGANTSYKTGNDVYTFDTATPFYRTIWDAGGTDTISVSNFTKGCTIDLQQGHFSKITIESDPLPSGYSGGTTATYDGTDNLAIAFGAVIENAIGGSGNDTLTGNSSNNVLTGGAGNDLLSGGAGVDTAGYSGIRSAYKVTKTTAGFTVSGGTDGTDTITGIERLLFSNTNLALDLDAAAGKTAKILGAVFGATSISNKVYEGIGIGLLDGGMTYNDLAALALTAAGAVTSQQVVKTLWTNIIGSAPTAAQAQPFIDMLAHGTTAGQLAAQAADSTENQQNINLVGLAQTGIEYVVYVP